MGSIANVWALVLAGGDGSRLRDLTTTSAGMHVPKQFCSLRGGPSLLQEALCRARAVVPGECILAVVAAQHRHWWSAPLQQLPASNVLAQPRNLGTAIGILWPLLQVCERNPDARIVILPSDHFVEDEPTLARSLRAAVDRLPAHQEEIVLLGIRAEMPDPDLGYIVPGAERDDGLFDVAQFVEKPSAKLARALISGGAFWNAFMIVATARALVAAFERRFDDVVQQVRAAVCSGLDRMSHSRALSALYEHLPVVDLSRDILQADRHPNLRVLPVASCGWSDLGTPRRVAETLQRLPSHDEAQTEWFGAATEVSLAERYARMVLAR